MGLLGDDSPEKLLNILIYLLGVYFVLRGIQEHKDLRVGAYRQITVCFDEELQKKYLLYTPTSMKNHQGGLRGHNKKKKLVWAYENADNVNHCVVHIFEKYLGLQLLGNHGCSPHMYLWPLAKYFFDGIPWYSCQPVGVYRLQNVLSSLCTRAGITGKQMNHALKATAATRLFQKGCDE